MQRDECRSRADLLQIVGTSARRRRLAHLLHRRSSKPISTEMMAITTSNSISVKPRREEDMVSYSG